MNWNDCYSTKSSPTMSDNYILTATSHADHSQSLTTEMDCMTTRNWNNDDRSCHTPGIMSMDCAMGERVSSALGSRSESCTLMASEQLCRYQIHCRRKPQVYQNPVPNTNVKRISSFSFATDRDLGNRYTDCATPSLKCEPCIDKLQKVKECWNELLPNAEVDQMFLNVQLCLLKKERCRTPEQDRSVSEAARPCTYGVAVDPCREKFCEDLLRDMCVQKGDRMRDKIFSQCDPDGIELQDVLIEDYPTSVCKRSRSLPPKRSFTRSKQGYRRKPGVPTLIYHPITRRVGEQPRQGLDLIEGKYEVFSPYASGKVPRKLLTHPALWRSSSSMSSRTMDLKPRRVSLFRNMPHYLQPYSGRGAKAGPRINLKVSKIKKPSSFSDKLGRITNSSTSDGPLQPTIERDKSVRSHLKSETTPVYVPPTIHQPQTSRTFSVQEECNELVQHATAAVLSAPAYYHWGSLYVPKSNVVPKARISASMSRARRRDDDDDDDVNGGFHGRSRNSRSSSKMHGSQSGADRSQPRGSKTSLSSTTGRQQSTNLPVQSPPQRVPNDNTEVYLMPEVTGASGHSGPRLEPLTVQRKASVSGESLARTGPPTETMDSTWKKPTYTMPTNSEIPPEAVHEQTKIPPVSHLTAVGQARDSINDASRPVSSSRPRGTSLERKIPPGIADSSVAASAKGIGGMRSPTQHSTKGQRVDHHMKKSMIIDQPGKSSRHTPQPPDAIDRSYGTVSDHSERSLSTTIPPTDRGENTSTLSDFKFHRPPDLRDTYASLDLPLGQRSITSPRYSRNADEDDDSFGSHPPGSPLTIDATGLRKSSLITGQTRRRSMPRLSISAMNYSDYYEERSGPPTPDIDQLSGVSKPTGLYQVSESYKRSPTRPESGKQSSQELLLVPLPQLPSLSVTEQGPDRLSVKSFSLTQDTERQVDSEDLPDAQLISKAEERIMTGPEFKASPRGSSKHSSLDRRVSKSEESLLGRRMISTSRTSDMLTNQIRHPRRQPSLRGSTDSFVEKRRVSGGQYSQELLDHPDPLSTGDDITSAKRRMTKRPSSKIATRKLSSRTSSRRKSLKRSPEIIRKEVIVTEFTEPESADSNGSHASLYDRREDIEQRLFGKEFDVSEILLEDEPDSEESTKITGIQLTDWDESSNQDTLSLKEVAALDSDQKEESETESLHILPKMRDAVPTPDSATTHLPVELADSDRMDRTLDDGVKPESGLKIELYDEQLIKEHIGIQHDSAVPMFDQVYEHPRTRVTGDLGLTDANGIVQETEGLAYGVSVPHDLEEQPVIGGLQQPMTFSPELRSEPEQVDTNHVSSGLSISLVSSRIDRDRTSYDEIASQDSVVHTKASDLDMLVYQPEIMSQEKLTGTTSSVVSLKSEMIEAKSMKRSEKFAQSMPAGMAISAVEYTDFGSLTTASNELKPEDEGSHDQLHRPTGMSMSPVNYMEVGFYSVAPKGELPVTDRPQPMMIPIATSESKLLKSVTVIQSDETIQYSPGTEIPSGRRMYSKEDRTRHILYGQAGADLAVTPQPPILYRSPNVVQSTSSEAPCFPSSEFSVNPSDQAAYIPYIDNMFTLPASASPLDRAQNETSARSSSRLRTYTSPGGERESPRPSRCEMVCLRPTDSFHHANDAASCGCCASDGNYGTTDEMGSTPTPCSCRPCCMQHDILIITTPGSCSKMAPICHCDSYRQDSRDRTMHQSSEFSCVPCPYYVNFPSEGDTSEPCSHSMSSIYTATPGRVHVHRRTDDAIYDRSASNVRVHPSLFNGIRRHPNHISKWRARFPRRSYGYNNQTTAPRQSVTPISDQSTPTAFDACDVPALPIRTKSLNLPKCDQSAHVLAKSHITPCMIPPRLPPTGRETPNSYATRKLEHQHLACCERDDREETITECYSTTKLDSYSTSNSNVIRTTEKFTSRYFVKETRHSNDTAEVNSLSTSSIAVSGFTLQQRDEENLLKCSLLNFSNRTASHGTKQQPEPKGTCLFFDKQAIFARRSSQMNRDVTSNPAPIKSTPTVSCASPLHTGDSVHLTPKHTHYNPTKHGTVRDLVSTSDKITPEARRILDAMRDTVALLMQDLVALEAEILSQNFRLCEAVREHLVLLPQMLVALLDHLHYSPTEQDLVRMVSGFNNLVTEVKGDSLSVLFHLLELGYRLNALGKLFGNELVPEEFPKVAHAIQSKLQRVRIGHVTRQYFHVPQSSDDLFTSYVKSRRLTRLEEECGCQVSLIHPEDPRAIYCPTDYRTIEVIYDEISGKPDLFQPRLDYLINPRRCSVRLVATIVKQMNGKEVSMKPEDAKELLSCTVRPRYRDVHAAIMSSGKRSY